MVKGLSFDYKIKTNKQLIEIIIPKDVSFILKIKQSLNESS